MIGKTVSHYRIIEKLGQGGMGVVYKARDTLLDRFVAVKVISPELLKDKVAAGAFIKEAKAASALNQPNILTVHDLVEAEGSRFIMMEFVEGQALRQLIGKKGLELKPLLSIASQVGEALSTAHKIGIIHRDLKPENIMVRTDGLVKVVDFGLAKLLEKPKELEVASATEYSTLPLSAPERISARGGVKQSQIAGTLPYMSPELLFGKTVDQRSDIFSFGIVLYEMATGQRPFDGYTTAETIDFIAQKDPQPIRELSRFTSEKLQDVIEKCLEKDPSNRYQHIEDMVVDLRRVKRESESGKPIQGPPLPILKPPRKTTPFQYAAFGALSAAVIAAVLTYVLYPHHNTVPELVADWGKEIDTATISRDGNLIAFDSDTSGQREIYIVPVKGGVPRQLTHGPGDKSEPRFSPDDKQLLYEVSGDVSEVWVDSTLGGHARKLISNATSADWAPNGTDIAYARESTGQPASLWVSDLAGNDEHSLYTSLFDYISDVNWSPDGKWIFLSDDGGPWLVSPQEYSRVDLKDKFGEYSGSVAWSPDSRSLYYSKREMEALNIWMTTISGGKTERVTHDIEEDSNPMPLPDGKGLLYSIGRSTQALWAASLKTNDREELVKGGWSSAPTISPDHKRVAFLKGEPGDDSGDVWTIDIDGKNAKQITKGMYSYNVFWSPNSMELAYSASVGPETPHRYHLFFIDLATEKPEQITRGTSDDYVCSWSPDGENILYSRFIEGKTTLIVRDLKSGNERVIGEDFDSAEYSRNGKWIVALGASDIPEKRGVWAFASQGGSGRRILPLVLSCVS
ncbi:MAG: serine/threonine protein kinase [Terriglobia bacterium]